MVKSIFKDETTKPVRSGDQFPAPLLQATFSSTASLYAYANTYTNCSRFINYANTILRRRFCVSDNEIHTDHYRIFEMITV